MIEKTVLTAIKTVRVNQLGALRGRTKVLTAENNVVKTREKPIIRLTMRVKIICV